MPSAMRWARCLGSPAKARAMNVAPAAGATDIGLNASSMAPSGEVVVTNPLSLVGEYWPLVRPYIWLFSTIWVIFGLRRELCTQWVAPDPWEAPSPVTAATWRA